MPLETSSEANDLFVLRISGTLGQADFAAAQADLARRIDAGAKPRVLALTENFDGWQKGADWNDLEFQLSHGDEIQKIAVVGDPRWETHALAFAGAGVRTAPVKFFPSGQEAAARAWLAE
jgi:hypothetical protein